MQIILTRHGEVEGIHPERFRGRMELELTELGLEHLLGNVQPHDLQAVDRADDLPCVHACLTIHLGSPMVFVKTSDRKKLREIAARFEAGPQG